MPPKSKYRLEALLKLKKLAKRKSEIDLAKAIRELEEEKEKLNSLEDKKKDIEQKREKARQDMGKKVSSGQSRVKDSQHHLGFMRKLKEDLEALEGEIEEQEEVIELAEQKLKRARRDYVDAATELNIMEKHKELWTKKIKKELTALENKKMNELAGTVHQMNKMRAL